jgi:hypothetical protein
MYCHRWLQDDLSYILIAVGNPVTPIGLVEPDVLPARGGMMLLRRVGFQCSTHPSAYTSLEDALRQLGVLKSPKGDSTRVLITDRQSALSLIEGEVDSGSVALVVDNVECLWNLQSVGLIHLAVVVEEPTYLLATAEPRVVRALHVRGRPRLIKIDDRDGKCVAKGRSFSGVLSPGKLVKYALSVIMSSKTPLEFLIT